jgi:hypothetical protein
MPGPLFAAVPLPHPHGDTYIQRTAGAEDRVSRKDPDPSPQDASRASAQTRVEASRWLAHL